MKVMPQTAAAATDVSPSARLRRERSTARWLVVLLTSFLLLNFLQPCCESLAELLPHRHGTISASNTGEHGQAGHHHAASHAHPDAHEHCATSDEIDTSLPDFLTAGAPDSEPQFVLVALLLIVSYLLSAGASARCRARHERGPPQRLYLSTLRLRI